MSDRSSFNLRNRYTGLMRATNFALVQDRMLHGFGPCDAPMRAYIRSVIKAVGEEAWSKAAASVLERDFPVEGE